MPLKLLRLIWNVHIYYPAVVCEDQIQVTDLGGRQNFSAVLLFVNLLCKQLLQTSLCWLMENATVQVCPHGKSTTGCRF